MNRDIIKYKGNIFCFVLLSLFPATLVIGPFIAELFMNIIILIFIYNVFKNKNYIIFKNGIFLFFIFFFIILIISLIFSEIFTKSAINVFFYFRFFIFSFAICEILKTNKDKIKYLYFCLSAIICVVVFDGYYQFFFNENILGFPQLRIDRLSGFFKDDLILGSYLFRILPILIGLTLYVEEKTYFSNKTRYFYRLNQLLIFFTIILIFLSGERASFFLTVIFLFIILMLLKLKSRIKLLSFSILIISVGIIFIFNTSYKDRYFEQLKRHIYVKKNSISFLINYMPMFETSIKMFKAKPILGFGPKSYRYYCDDDKFVTYYYNRKITIDNTLIKPNFSWKEPRNYLIYNIFIQEGDIIKKGDKLFSYFFSGESLKELKYYYSDKEGLIQKINLIKIKNLQENNKTSKFGQSVNNTVFAQIKPLKSQKTLTYYADACNTHPHNIYIQLLAELGIIGFLIVFFLFLTLCFVILKIFINGFIKKNKNIITNLEICLLVNFLVILWPLTTSGNFFNNWINIISFYPLGFYLYIHQKK